MKTADKLDIHCKGGSGVMDLMVRSKVGVACGKYHMSAWLCVC